MAEKHRGNPYRIPEREHIRLRVDEKIATYDELLEAVQDLAREIALRETRKLFRAYTKENGYITKEDLDVEYSGDGDLVTDVKYAPETGIFTVEKNAQTADDEEMDDLLDEEYGDDEDDEPEPDDGDDGDDAGGEQP